MTSYEKKQLNGGKMQNKGGLKMPRTDKQWHDLYDRLEKAHEPQTQFVPYEDLESESWDELAHSRGSSSFLKHKYGPKNAPFCGTAGGAMFDTYPVDTPAHARSALSYSRHAPDEMGVRKCVNHVQKVRGWSGQRLPQSAYATQKPKPISASRRSRGPMSSSARTHEKSKYPGVGGKYNTYFDDED